MNTTSNMIVVWCLVAAVLLQQATASGLRHHARARTLQEDISFRLRLASDSDWCVECEYHSSSSGSSCREGDMLVVDDCGSSPRQRFIMDGNRISPHGSPDLCLQRSDNNVRLRDCSSSVSRQQWYGVDENDEFELYTGSNGRDDDSESMEQCTVYVMPHRSSPLQPLLL
jgi:hypothetical protein